MSHYRPNVCGVLTGGQPGQVLMFRRIDGAFLSHPWQFPQGGLEPHEKPRQGLLRELKEEIGTADVEILAKAPQPIRYEYPPEVREELRATGNRMAKFRGQEQHWFLARLRHGTEGIHFRHQPAEFDAFEWVDVAEVVRRVVPFKAQAYKLGLIALGLLPRE